MKRHRNRKDLFVCLAIIFCGAKLSAAPADYFPESPQCQAAKKNQSQCQKMENSQRTARCPRRAAEISPLSVTATQGLIESCRLMDATSDASIEKLSTEIRQARLEVAASRIQDHVTRSLVMGAPNPLDSTDTKKQLATSAKFCRQAAKTNSALGDATRDLLKGIEQLSGKKMQDPAQPQDMLLRRTIIAHLEVARIRARLQTPDVPPAEVRDLTAELDKIRYHYPTIPPEGFKSDQDDPLTMEIKNNYLGFDYSRPNPINDESIADINDMLFPGPDGKLATFKWNATSEFAPKSPAKAGTGYYGSLYRWILTPPHPVYQDLTRSIRQSSLDVVKSSIEAVGTTCAESSCDVFDDNLSFVDELVGQIALPNEKKAVVEKICNQCSFEKSVELLSDGAYKKAIWIGAGTMLLAGGASLGCALSGICAAAVVAGVAATSTVGGYGTIAVSGVKLAQEGYNVSQVQSQADRAARAELVQTESERAAAAPSTGRRSDAESKAEELQDRKDARNSAAFDTLSAVAGAGATRVLSASEKMLPASEKIISVTGDGEMDAEGTSELATAGPKKSKTKSAKGDQRAPSEELYPHFFNERQSFQAKVSFVSEIFGKEVETGVIDGLPDSMQVSRYQTPQGKTSVVYKKAVRLENGKVGVTYHEIQMDPLTGTVNANYPGGRKFLEDLVREKGSRCTVVTIDVNNLGFVSKNFAGGRMTGDKYLQATAEMIRKTVGRGGHLVRTGGDEFALVLDETDPKKVQQLVAKLGQNMKDPSIHDIFYYEKMGRAYELRKPDRPTFSPEQVGTPDYNSKMADYQAKLAEYQQKLATETPRIKAEAPYLREGLSIGSTKPAAGEDLEDVIQRAEKQAQLVQKIPAKEAANQDATKYEGKAAEPGRRINLVFIPKAEVPVPAPASSANHVQSPRLSPGLSDVPIARTELTHRVGDIQVVTYQNAVGDRTLRVEEWSTVSGRRVMVSHDVPINGKTGFIDNSSEWGQKVSKAFIEDAKEPNRASMLISVRNLGVVNYFADGTKAGDQMLATAAKTISRELRKADIPIKFSGSDFLLNLHDLPPARQAALAQRLQQALRADLLPIYEKEQEDLRFKFETAVAARDLALAKRCADSIEKIEKSKAQLSIIQTTTINASDTYNSVVSRLERELAATAEKKP